MAQSHAPFEAPYRLQPDWSFALVAAWQAAMTLDGRARRVDVARAVEALLTLPATSAHSALEQNLLRGYLLELARGLKDARRAVPAYAAHKVDAFCGWLQVPTRTTENLNERAKDVLTILNGGDARTSVVLAERVRALLEEPGGQKLRAAALGRIVGSNTRRVERAFRRRYGESVASYRRACQAKAALDSIVMGLPLKCAIEAAGCSESTLRRRVVTATGCTPRAWSRRGLKRALSVGKSCIGPTQVDQD